MVKQLKYIYFEDQNFVKLQNLLVYHHILKKNLEQLWFPLKIYTSYELSWIKASLKIFGKTVSEVKVCSRLNFEILTSIFLFLRKKEF